MAIKKSDLYASIWASCDQLRGGMDASQYKDYVLFKLFIADRIAYQENGRPMKFVSLCDYTGFVETELFAETYRHFGMGTIKSPLLVANGTVNPFENGKGFTLRVLSVNAAANRW